MKRGLLKGDPETWPVLERLRVPQGRTDHFGAEGLALGDGPFQNVEIAAQVVEGGGQVVGVVTLVGNLSKNPEIFLMQDPGPPPTISF